MSFIDSSIIAVYLIFIFVLGLWAGRYVKNIKEYAVAHRSYSAVVLFATLSASFIGGGFSFGNADTVFQNGIGPATALWGFSLMLILVGLFIAPRMGKFRRCISTGDIMEKQYGPSARIVAGVLGVLVCMGILGAQIGAIGAVFELFTPLTFMQGVFIGCGIVIIYTAFGGISSVVLTDVIQFVMLVVFIPLTLVLGLCVLGGFSAMAEKVPSEFLQITGNDFTPLMWISLFLSFLIGETLVPPYVQRLLIAKSPKETRKGTLWSGFLSIPFFLISGLIGLVALALNPDLPSNLAMPNVVQTVLPPVIKGLTCAAIISIVMSSADSFLNASSVCFIEDVLKPILKRNIIFPNTPAKDLWLIQATTLLIGGGAVFLALKISNVLDILRFAYNFWSPVMLVPLVAVLLGKKVCKSAFVAGAIAGASVIIIAFVYNKSGVIFGLDAVVVGTFANLICFVPVNYFCRKRIVK